jgi:hypothetical protein
MKRQVLADVRRAISSPDHEYVFAGEGTTALILVSVERNATEKVLVWDFRYSRFSETPCRENYMGRMESNMSPIPVNHHSPSLCSKVIGRDR